MTALLEVSDLSVEFRVGDGYLRAVHGVSCALEEGRRSAWWASRGAARP